ncbi:MAG: pyridoxamine 5'-phosphate oxidase family protein [Deltaproteobacteria bacterium]|nr:pyridoxamine 5'-phosphate oxidase family protein [Deltaproteobacteria bacterium]
MDLKAYFEGAKGTGVIATADNNGKVNMAIYSKPHFMDNGEIAFIMTDKLTHNNIMANGSAAYLFKEDGEGYKGKRLYLTKLREEKDSELLYTIRSRKYHSDQDDGKSKFLVFFRVDKELPLIGEGK